jgi:hypothetical protein
VPRNVPTGYHTPAQINQFLNDLATKNPDLAQVVDLTKLYKTGPTIDGNSVIGIKIATNVTTIQDKYMIDHNLLTLLEKIFLLHLAIMQERLSLLKLRSSLLKISLTSIVPRILSIQILSIAVRFGSSQL